MRPASSSTLRALRQRSRIAPRRFASSNTEQVQKKAQETLSTVQKQAEKAWEASSKYLGPLGERLGSLLGSYRAPVTYNLSVARELLKHIYIAERLQPPTVAEFKAAYSMVLQRLSSPAAVRELLSSGQGLRIGIYAAEAYGIFSIGEMIGRRSIVGYNVE